MSVKLLPSSGIVYPDDTVQSTAAIEETTYPEMPGVHATLSASYTSSKGNPIVYNTIQSNHGGGFNTVTGKYTAPVAGYYFVEVGLHFTSLGYGAMLKPYCSIQVTGANAIYIDGGCSLQIQTYVGSPRAQAIVKMAVGDVVFGRFFASQNITYNLITTLHRTFFKATLLSEE